MTARKLIILGVALLACAIGAALALMLPGSHDAAPEHEGSHALFLVAVLVPCWSAVFISFSARKRRRRMREYGE